MADPLAQIVALLRPGAPYAKLASAAGVWRVRREVEGQVFYNLTLMGRALLEVDGKPPVLLQRGDFVLIPASEGFIMSSVDPAPPAGLFSQPVMQEPGHVRLGDPDAPVDTQQLVGHCVFGAPDADLLLTLLPDLVVVRGGDGDSGDLDGVEAGGGDGQGGNLAGGSLAGGSLAGGSLAGGSLAGADWRGGNRLAMLVRLVAEEARASRPGRDAVLERLLEVLLIEALRASSETPAGTSAGTTGCNSAGMGVASPPGLLRGLADARLSAALHAVHADPARDWTVAELARGAGLSRSTFFARFEREVGASPMAYLTRWRMTLAKDLLRAGRCSIVEIARRLGYGSASAFSTAFSREVGLPPALYGRTVGAEVAAQVAV